MVAFIGEPGLPRWLAGRRRGAGVPATVAGRQAWVAGRWAAGKGGMACR